jgi:hypothetical protein
LSFKARVPVFAAALWWGSLTTTGFVVVPLLFSYLPTTAMAGQMAARLFTAQTWLSLGCGAVLLIATRSRDSSRPAGWTGGALLFILGGLLLALLSEFAVAPRIVARDNLRLWHAVGSGMYLVQWLCAGVVLFKSSAASPGQR